MSEPTRLKVVWRWASIVGALAALCAAYEGGASVFRVHDVGPARQALDVLRRITQMR